jgi:hypothetical protein
MIYNLKLKNITSLQVRGVGLDEVLFVCGRGERIRTSDILLPKQARYQAALRPANQTKMLNITHGCKNQEIYI